MGAVANKIFFRYERMADYYANKIWNESNIGLEKEDVRQELKTRLFMAIKTYSKKYKEFRDTGKNKPVPIEFYLKTTMINKSRDIIKEINSATFIKSSSMEFERGNDMQEIYIDKMDIRIGVFSIMEILNPIEKKVMKELMLRNFDTKAVKRNYKGKRNIVILMNHILDKIKVFLEENQNPVNSYEYFITQE